MSEERFAELMAGSPLQIGDVLRNAVICSGRAPPPRSSYLDLVGDWQAELEVKLPDRCRFEVEDTDEIANHRRYGRCLTVVAA